MLKKKKKYSVLINGYYGVGNLGDDYILYSLLETLSKTQKVNKIYVTVSNDDYKKYEDLFSRFSEIDIESIKNGNCKNLFIRILKAFQIFRNIDYFIIGGGGIFTTKSNIILIKKLVKILVAKFYSIKTCMYGIDCIVSNKKSTKLIWSKIIVLCDFISTRNYNSYVYLNSCKNMNVFSFSDITFSLETREEKIDDIRIIKKLGLFPKKYIVWSFAKPWTEMELKNRKIQYRYKLLCQQLANRIMDANNKDYINLFVPFFEKNDISFIKDILSYVKQNSLVYKISSENMTIGEQRYLFKYAKYAFCMRFHSVVFSLYYGIPFFAISYSPKITNLLKEINYQYYVEIGIRKKSFFCDEFDINSLELDSKFKQFIDIKDSNEYIENNNKSRNYLRKLALDGEIKLMDWINT